jgi:hypothetical protein
MFRCSLSSVDTPTSRNGTVRIDFENESFQTLTMSRFNGLSPVAAEKKDS